MAINPISAQIALRHPEHSTAIEDALTEVKARLKGAPIALSAMASLVEDQTLVGMAVQITWRVLRGKLALYICPSVAYNVEGTLTKARNLVYAAEHSHIAKSRLYISIPATWHGIEAAKRLQNQHGIECDMTMVVCTAQAIACAQAGVARISCPIAAIERWHAHHDDNPFYDADDIKSHRGIIFVKRMAEIFRLHSYKTQIVPYDFQRLEEVVALAGLPMICLPMRMIRDLESQTGTAINTLDQVRGIYLPRDQNSMPAHQRPAPGVTPNEYSDRETFEQALAVEQIALHVVPELLHNMEEETRELRTLIEAGIQAREHNKVPLANRGPQYISQYR